MSQELTTKENNQVGAVSGGILGMDNITVEDIAIPRARLVQALSKDITLADGKTKAPQGSFFFKDLQEAVEEMRFVLFRQDTVKYQNVDNRTGEKKEQLQKALFCYNLDTDKPFIIGFSVGSFGRIKALTSQIIAKKPQTQWDYAITMTSEEVANRDNQNYYVPNFVIDEEPLEAEEVDRLTAIYRQYGGKMAEEMNKSEDEASNFDDEPVDENGMPF